MITELNEIDPLAEGEIVGGHRIDVTQNNIRNPRIHRSLEQMARLCLFMLECDSNNTSSKVKPSDVKAIRQQWDICKSEFEFSIAEENNDLPSGAYEHAYKIFTPHQKEIARVRNVKIKACLSEVWDTMNHMLSVDSSNTQGFTAEDDSETMRARLAFVDRVMDRWVGNAASFSDLGLVAPAYEILGKVLPDVDSDWAQKLEPSKKLPDPRLPDVADS